MSEKIVQLNEEVIFSVIGPTDIAQRLNSSAL